MRAAWILAAALASITCEAPSANLPAPEPKPPLEGEPSPPRLTLVGPTEELRGVVGCIRSVPLEIRNDGPQPIALGPVELSGATSSFLIEVATPEILAPGETFLFRAWFRPEVVGTLDVYISVGGRVRDRRIRSELRLSGEGVPDERQINRFPRPEAPPLDVLLIMDDGPATPHLAAATRDNLRTLRELLSRQPLDWRLAITTTDPEVDGRILPLSGAEWVDRGTAPGVWEQLIPTPGPLHLQLGLQGLARAIGPPHDSGHNLGFRRPEVPLLVIVVAPRDDQSPGSADSWRGVLSRLLGPDDAVWAATGASERCGPAWGAVEIGARYAEVVAANRGAVMSICNEDWAQQPFDFASISPGEWTLRLDLPARAGTLEVLVDGVPLPATSATGQRHWRYDSEEATIVISAVATPLPGSEVVARYWPACDPS